MDIHEGAIEASLRRVLWADEAIQQHLISELAARPDETLDGLIAVLKKYEKPLLSLATKAIHAIGYPRNAAAIPWLVRVASDQNAPGRKEVAHTLEDMDVDVVLPFFLEMLLSRDDRNEDWSYTVDGILTILGWQEQWVRACGPAIAYLIAQDDYVPGNAPDIDYLLSLVEYLLPTCTYAIPALYHVALRERNNDNGKLARRLLFSFEETALKPYQRLLASLAIEEG